MAALESWWSRRRKAVGLVLALMCFALALVLHLRRDPTPRERSEEVSREQTVDARDASSPSAIAPVRLQTDGPSQEVNAAWYDVPAKSLAKRRAGVQELTAAHNRLPLGTLIRVTHLENGKSVVVRITDRGIRDRRVKLDLCKEAAEELEMVKKGIARVRLEVVREEQGAVPQSRTAAPQ